MCKVRITNRGSNYSNFNTPSKEFDIPTEVVPILKNIFYELNATRKTASQPEISIETLWR